MPLTGLMQVKDVIPSWILNPETLPPGTSKNNCTFAFRQDVPQWDFHADAGCWERSGPDGWTRQQQYKIHVPQHNDCGGGPADVSPIRVCLAPGPANPCPINALTGPNGCAICVRSLTCHCGNMTVKPTDHHQWDSHRCRDGQSARSSWHAAAPRLPCGLRRSPSRGDRGRCISSPRAGRRRQ
jgi:hypothetical protein